MGRAGRGPALVRQVGPVLNEDDPPFYKWFEGGTLNASYNCLDRHVEAGNGDKVAFHWRGEEGEERDVTYAELLRDTQKFADALKDHGIGKGDVVGIFLPMIPRSPWRCSRARASAPSTTSSSAASRRVGEGADGLLRRQALIVRRRRAAQGQDRADQAAGRRLRHRRRDDVRGQEHRPRRRADGRRRRVVPRGDGGRRRRVRGGAAGRRVAALHPLHVGLDQQAEGHAAHDQRLPDGGVDDEYVFDLKPDEDVYWCSADVGWVTGHSYIVYGPLLDGATASCARAARTTRTRTLVGDDRAVRRDALLHRADGDPRVHQVGRGVPSTTCHRSAAARHRR